MIFDCFLILREFLTQSARSFFSLTDRFQGSQSRRLVEAYKRVLTIDI